MPAKFIAPPGVKFFTENQMKDMSFKRLIGTHGNKWRDIVKALAERGRHDENQRIESLKNVAIEQAQEKALLDKIKLEKLRQSGQIDINELLAPTQQKVEKLEEKLTNVDNKMDAIIKLLSQK